MTQQNSKSYIFANRVLGNEAENWLEQTKHLPEENKEQLLWDIFETNKFRQFCPTCKEARDYDALQQNIIRAYMEGKLIWK